MHKLFILLVLQFINIQNSEMSLELNVYIIDCNLDQTVKNVISQNSSNIHIYSEYLSLIFQKDFKNSGLNTIVKNLSSFNNSKSIENYLIHLILPETIKNSGPNCNFKLIYLSLKKYSLFYKNIYGSIQNDKSIKIIVLIPSMKYFKSIINIENPVNYELLNNKIIFKEVIQKLDFRHKFILIDEDKQKLKLTIDFLKSYLLPQIIGNVLPSN